MPLVVALACWAAGAAVFGVLPQGSGAKALTAVTFSLATAAFAAIVLLRASSHAEDHEKAFWQLLGWAMVFRFAGNAYWTASRVLGLEIETPGIALQDVAYAVSYPLFTGGMLHLVALTMRRITLVSALDTLAVMLSVGTLVWYFILGPASAEAGLNSLREAVVALSQPVCDAALLFLGLVVASSRGRPRFIWLLNAGFATLLISDAAYLGIRATGPYESGNWPEMLWALGMILVGLTALHPDGESPTAPASGRIEPWRVLSFWLGPLSPPIHFLILLVWGGFNPPLPGYVLAGCAALLFYLALRVGLVSFVTRNLSEEQETLVRELRQGHIIHEPHNTVKQSVHDISLMLSSALDAERREDPDTARELLGRALEKAKEAEFQISRPYDEMQTLLDERPPHPDDFLRHRLEKFEEYFGIKTHDDLQASLGALGPDEIAAANRIVIEALWNAAKHSSARNLYLESRRVGSLLIIRIRDDGRGFDSDNPPPGVGLNYMRRRVREVGASLDVISSPGRGTTVQLRFDGK